MTVATTIPVVVTPEAAERVAELGMQAQLEEMIEHAKEVVKGVCRIEVVMGPLYDTDDEPRVTIEAWCERTPPVASVFWEWGTWMHNTFPPEVWLRFAMDELLEENHAG